MLDPEHLIPTRHFVAVARRRNITLDEVADVINYAEVTDTCGGKTRHYAGDLCVVTVPGAWPGTYVLITALLRCQHRWTDEDARSRKAVSA